MKRLTQLPARSKLLLAGLLVLALVLTVFVYIEVTQSRKELLGNVRAEASILIETLNRGSETIINANEELENALIDRLIVTAQLIDHMEQHGSLNSERLRHEAHELGVALVVLFDGAGDVAAASAGELPTAHAGNVAAAPEHAAAIERVIAPVLNGTYIWTSDARIISPWSGDTLFVLAHERRTADGAVLIGYSSAQLLEVRKRLGIGQIAQQIGRLEDIVYVVLQDEDGIITASRDVEEMSAVRDDAFLREALVKDSTQTRFREYAGRRIFEVVKRLEIDGAGPVLSRIGLSLERVRNIQQRSMRRVIFIAAGFFVTALILIVLLLTRQRYGVLAEEHRKIRTYTGLVLDNIADAVVATDSQGVITVFNKAAERLLELDADTAIGTQHAGVIPSDSLLIERTHTDRATIDYAETTLPTAQGERRTVAVSTSIIRTNDGSLDTVVCIARDITEQRRAQEQLQRRDRLTAMGELAGGIAHEIRNPLNAINIIAQRFNAEFEPKADAEEFHRLSSTIRSEVKRVNNIITQFLEFARPPRLALAETDMSRLLRDSVDVIRSQAMMKQVRIQLFTDSHLPMLADAEKMQQVFLNLLQNALDAVQDGGEIKCIACRKNDRVMVSIADNGPGIPEALQSKIFNLYFTTKSSGTGLGLSIVHQIVGEHGGDIAVTSSEGHGTTFRMVFPPMQENRHDD